MNVQRSSAPLGPLVIQMTRRCVASAMMVCISRPDLEESLRPRGAEGGQLVPSLFAGPALVHGQHPGADMIVKRGGSVALILQRNWIQTLLHAARARHARRGHVGHFLLNSMRYSLVVNESVAQRLTCPCPLPSLRTAPHCSAQHNGPPLKSTRHVLPLYSTKR